MAFPFVYVNGTDTIPVCLFLEYDLKNGLRSFCDKKKLT